MTDTPRILLIDDEPSIREPLSEYLEAQGFAVTDAANASEARSVLRAQTVDLVVSDIMMPGEDGLSICRRLRAAENQIPVIMLTAKGDDVDRIVGLEMGADDYVAKPFNPRELVARIQAVMRRQPHTLPGAPTPEDEIVAFGRVKVNLGTRVLVRDGEEIQLTTGEFSLLKVLLTHPRQPLSRDKLMELARGREYGVFDRAIDVQVSRLRKLVEDDPAKPRYIQTVWGFGYVFVPDEQKGGEDNGGQPDTPAGGED